MKTNCSMKELCCKVMAAVFIILIVISLVNMRNDIQKINNNLPVIVMSNSVLSFDTGIVVKEKYVDIVEETPNPFYHVVYRDKFGHTVNAIYTKKQLQKVFIFLAHPHE